MITEEEEYINWEENLKIKYIELLLHAGFLKEEELQRRLQLKNNTKISAEILII